MQEMQADGRSAHNLEKTGFKEIDKGPLQNESFAAVPSSAQKGKLTENVWKTATNLSVFCIAKPVPAHGQRLMLKGDSIIRYAAEISDRCVRNRPLSRFIQNFFRSNASARKNSSVRTFFLPRVRKRWNPKSFLSSPKAPST